MRWYVSAQGQSHGPMEEQQVVELVRSARAEYVRGEGGGDWLPIPQSPFAAYIPPGFAPQMAPQFPGGTPMAQGARAAAKPSKSTGAQWLFVIGAVVGAMISSALGWLGILGGIALIAWSIVRHRRGQRSLMAIAWSKPVGLMTTVGTVAVGVWFSSCGMVSALAKHETAAKEAAQAAEERQRADAAAQSKARARKELERGLPANLDGWKKRLSAALDAADRQTPAQGRSLTNAVQEEVAAYATKMGQPTPPDLDLFAKQTAGQHAALDAWVKLVEAAQTVASETAKGKAAAAKASWLAADSAFEEALAALDEIEEAPSGVRARLPAGFDVAKKRSEVKQLRTQIAGPLAQAKKRAEREEEKRREEAAKEAAYRATCGAKPVVSGWDGEVIGLESALKQTAHDPDSIDVENCTEPVLTQGICWRFRCSVRGKNMFGALILQQKWFSFSQALGFQETSE